MPTHLPHLRRAFVCTFLLTASVPASAAAAQTAPPLPSWVPAENTVAVLTPTNTFRSVVAPYFEGYYSVKIANDYSGGFLNPYFGTYGACLFFGGGHAACNDNSVIALVLGES